jgi:hypothetical protein
LAIKNGRKLSYPDFKELFRYLPGGTEENHEKLQSEEPVYGQRFQPIDLPDTNQDC